MSSCLTGIVMIRECSLHCIVRYAEHLVPYYTELAQAGVDQGLLVFGHDHVGHGESEGERVLVTDMEEFVAPVIQHCQHVSTININPNI